MFFSIWIIVQADLSIVKATMVRIEACIRVSVITTLTSQRTCKILQNIDIINLINLIKGPARYINK